jgi:hypothetical protein
MSTQREADLLEAMKYASLPEQRRLTAELDQIRADASLAVEADRDTELADAIVTDHLTPVMVHGMHSTATDWLGEDTEYGLDDLQSIGQTMRAEASVWYGGVSEAVRHNRSELRQQATGVARRLGSQYGEVADQASSIFMDYVGRLVTAEGTDMAGIPSAADGKTNPDLTPWSEEGTAEGVESPDEGSAPSAADAPSVPEGSEHPAAPAPPAAASGGTTEPSDSGPSSLAPELPDDESFAYSGPGAADTTAPVQAASARRRQGAEVAKPGHWNEDGEYTNEPGGEEVDEDDFRKKHNLGPRFESAQQRAIRQYLGVEEGQDFPVPGEVDEEQDGEAKSSLPYTTTPSERPDTFPTFIPPAPASGDTSSTRAPNMRASRTSSGPILTSDIDPHQPHTFVPHHGGSGHECEVCTGWPDHPIHQSGGIGSIMHDPSRQGSRRTAITTGPNPQGSFVYDPIQVESKGYEEGFAYALTWSPGKPIPAALSSAASIGHKYNAEYVAGYKRGVTAGVGALSSEFQTAFASAARAVVLSSRQVEADANTLQFADINQTVAFPFTWSTGTGSASGAADVGSVPTPGSSVADYPQPSNASQGESAVGDTSTELDPIIDGVQAEAFRRVVRANASRLDFNRTAAEYGDTRPHQENWDAQKAAYDAKHAACPHCKSKRTRSGDLTAICGPHRDAMRAAYNTHPASENYWTSSRHTAGDPGWISNDPDWWANKNKGGYGMPNSHPFWAETPHEDIGQWRVFQKDDTWYGFNRQQNAWLDPKNTVGRQAVVDYVNGFNEKPTDIWA